MKIRASAVALLLLIVTSVAAFSWVTQVGAVTATWSSPQTLTKTARPDFLPEIIQTSDLKVWIFWEFFDDIIANADIHYKTYDWTTWLSLQGNLQAGGSPEQPLSPSAGQDIGPQAAQLPNGTLFVSFSSDKSGNYDVYLKRYNAATGWSSDLPVSQNPGREETGTILAASDGSLWVFWDRQDPTGNRNIWYKVYRNGAWTAEASLTSDSYPFLNRMPAAAQMRDGRIWLVWSQVQNEQFSRIFLYYRIFDGASWLARQSLTSGNSAVDRHPEIIQDGDSNIWLFWNREVPVGSCKQEDLFYKNSSDNGASWSSEARITNDNAITNCSQDFIPDDQSVSAAQLRDFKIWLFWASDRNDSSFDIYYSSSQAFPVHDVAVLAVTASPLLLRRGRPVTVDVTVANPGAYPETLQLTVKAENVSTIIIATRTLSLASGGVSNFTFTWNTSAANPARYRVSAVLQPVTGESSQNQANNSLTDGRVHVVPPGDVNYSGKVDITDLAIVAFAYATVPGDLRWNQDADLDYNLIINLIDAAIVAFWYGATS